MMHFIVKRFVFPSIKVSLIFWVTLFLFPILLIITFRSYFSVQHFANVANDQALFNVALSVSNSVEQNQAVILERNPDLMSNFKKYVKENHYYYRILNDKQEQLLGNDQLALPNKFPNINDKVFYSAKLNGEQLRLVAFSYPATTGKLMIVVGETFVLREAMERDVIWVFIVSEVIIILFLILALNFSLNRGLSSFEKVRDLILKRRPTDMHPIDAGRVPREVKSIVDAMNDLMGRVKEMVDHRQKFIANASHQLKTPLAGLKLQVESVLSVKDPEKINHALSQISHSTDKLTRLNKQLLSLARIDEGGTNQMVQLSQLDLIELASHIVAQWVPIALTKKMDLGLQADESKIFISGNAFLIEEMLNNLIENAIQYNAPNTNITVHLNRVETKVYLKVEDNGPGIPLEEQDKIFQRFHRLPGANQSNGCGLGMAIVREIMEQHHGEVDVRFTDTVHQSGTTVVCQFPL